MDILGIYIARVCARVTAKTARSSLLVPLLLLLLAGSAASPAWAQLYSGSLTGMVTDPTEAVVPGEQLFYFL